MLLKQYSNREMEKLYTESFYSIFKRSTECSPFLFLEHIPQYFIRDDNTGNFVAGNDSFEESRAQIRKILHAEDNIKKALEEDDKKNKTANIVTGKVTRIDPKKLN